MKKSSKSIIVLLSVALLGALAVGGTSKWFTDWSGYTDAGEAVKNWVNGSGNPTSTTRSSSSSSPSPAAAVRIQELSTGTDGNGHPTQTFSYTITPSYADDNIVFAIAWSTEDGTHTTSNLSSYVTASIDTSAKTVTLTCLQAFDRRIALTVRSYTNSSVSATVDVDYLRKVLDIRVGGAFEIPCDTYDSSRTMVSCTMSSDKVSFVQQVGGQINDLSKIVYDTSVYSLDELGSPTVTFDKYDAYFLGYGNVIQPIGSRSYDGTFSRAANSTWAYTSGSLGSVSSVVAAANSGIAALSSADRLAFKTATYDGSNRKFVVLHSNYYYTVSWGGVSKYLTIPVAFTIHPDQLTFNIPAESVTPETGAIKF